MGFSLKQGKWLNKPKSSHIDKDSIFIDTEPQTDFWQRSYYGFQNDNAPAFLFNRAENFTFTAKVSFNYQCLFDQYGLIIHIDSKNWFKASIGYDHANFSKLGRVVTNMGDSDWATNVIDTPESIYYRLNRPGPDFLIEYSLDGIEFHQMRIFHLHKLGETTAEMGKQTLPLATAEPVSFGIYACSPQNSNFRAYFSSFKFEKCAWTAHK